MHDNRVVTTSKPVKVTTCPTFTTRTNVCPTVCPVDLVDTTAVVAPTTVTPTATDLNALLGQLGLGTGLTGLGTGLTGLGKGLGANPLAQAALNKSAPSNIFNNPIAQLGGLSPFAALSAVSPSAALSALSPTLNKFNPAINPAAALLQFNPAAAPTLALTGLGKGGKAAKPFAKPFGKIGKI